MVHFCACAPEVTGLMTYMHTDPLLICPMVEFTTKLGEISPIHRRRLASLVRGEGAAVRTRQAISQGQSVVFVFNR